MGKTAMTILLYMCPRTFYFENSAILFLSFFFLDTCPSLSPINNGILDYFDNPIKNDTSLNESFFLGYTVASFFCNDGYISPLSATGARKICQPNGTWVGSPFMCIGEKMK